MKKHIRITGHFVTETRKRIETSQYLSNEHTKKDYSYYIVVKFQNKYYIRFIFYTFATPKNVISISKNGSCFFRNNKLLNFIF